MTEAVAPPPVARRSRVRFVYWAVGAIVVLLGAAIAAFSTVGFEGAAAVRFVAGSEVATLPGFEGGAHVLRYRHGETVTFSFRLENESSLPVTVTGVRLDDRDEPLLAVERASVGADELPFRVGGGEAVDMRITARYGNCRYYHEREIESFAAAIVAVDVLGLGLTRTVEFDHPLVVHSPMIVECPDRTLVRDDDVRD